MSSSPTKHRSLAQPARDYFEQLPTTYKGVTLALTSTALFVVVGVLVRILSKDINLFQILLSRQVVFTCLLLPAIASNFKLLLAPKHLPLHGLRITGAFFALYFGFLTVSNIPLADATALGFTQVLFVAVISKTFLSEKINPGRLASILIGFAGVLLVVQPKFEVTSVLYTSVGLIAALGAAVAVVCVRKITQTEHRVALLTYQAVFVGLIALIPSLISWQSPTLQQWLLLVLVGVISSVAQWIGVTAYKWGEANVIANIEYAKIVYSLIFGYWLFAEIPNSLALIGVAIIIASGLLPYFISRRLKAT